MPALAMITEFFRKPAIVAPGISKCMTSSATARIVASGSISNAAETMFR
jgi:hypothetical protein